MIGSNGKFLREWNGKKLFYYEQAQGLHRGMPDSWEELSAEMRELFMSSVEDMNRIFGGVYLT